MKKQETVAGLFFSMFLRAAVIILGIFIIVFGIIFLVKVAKDGGDSADKPATTVDSNVLTESETHDDLLYNPPAEDTTEATTEVATTEEQTEPSFDKNILVLNSTEVVGLAGRWCEKLNGAGYTNTYASDYSVPLTTTKVVSTTDGVGRDLVSYFNGATYEVGTVSEGASVSTDEYDIVIIIGSSDDDQ